MKHILLWLRQDQESFANELYRELYRLVQLISPSKRQVIYFILAIICIIGPKPFAFTQDILLGLTPKGGAQGFGTAFSIKSDGTDFTIQKSFEVSGYSPSENLCKGKDGNFYGMTEFGGSYEDGTIFKMTPSGTITILWHLRDFWDGSYPRGSLVQGTDGNFYGMTNRGGHRYNGTIFKITPNGTFTVLHHFDYNDGALPQGSLVQGADGSFYGMTPSKGKNNAGTIFKVTTKGTFTLLHTLNSATDGNKPFGNLVPGTNGHLYGMTSGGGRYNSGTVFSITPDGTFTILRHLETAPDGGKPSGSLMVGKDGYLYGMTPSGGMNNFGTIFKMASDGTFTVLRHLSNLDGVSPMGSLVQGIDGSAYGMTTRGGAKNYGTFFKIMPDGAFTVISHLRKLFPFRQGNSLVQDTDGNFYGMTYNSGTRKGGTIFKISLSGVNSVLVEFPDISKPVEPKGSLVQAHDGSFYGMANGTSTIFKMCNSTFSGVATFDYVNTGGYLEGDLIQGTDGNFYGMTNGGGVHNGGTIFKVTPTGILTVLHHFKIATDGGMPYGSLVQGTDGNFYGMTYGGGINYNGNFNNIGGTIFKITPDGVFSVLKNFDSKTGSNPYGSLVQGKDGSFYGLANGGGKNSYGTIFKITSDGNFMVLHNLNLRTDGGVVLGSLVQGSDGNFYGMTHSGGRGSNNAGTIFKITTDGIFTVLHHFNYTKDGANSKSDLVLGSDGSLYGMTWRGGMHDAGTIFKITTDGVFKVLRHLNPTTDGGGPIGNLIIQKPNPVAHGQSVSAIAGEAKTVTLSGTATGYPVTYTIVNQPKNGTLTGSGVNYTYLPKPGFTGSDSFDFTITWGCQTSMVQTVAISVTGDSLVNPAAWNLRYGGSGIDRFTVVINTSDGGYMSGGYSNSEVSGDKSHNSRGGADYWIIKTDQHGVKQWDQRYGGASHDYLNRIIPTQDGGYLLAGSSTSGKGGDKSEGRRGDQDYWIVKISSDGTKQWDKTYGGSGFEDLRKVNQLSNGDYLLAGTSSSPVSGEKSQSSQGGKDYWIVRVGSTGVKLWDKRYGGTADESLESFTKTMDNGIILAGSSASGKSGDKSQSGRGGKDYWLVKIDQAGNQLWDQRYGGNQDDELFSVGITTNGDYFVAGHSSSGQSGDKSQPSHGASDYWMLKLSSTGQKLWDKSFGGSSTETLRSIIQMADEGFVLAGSSDSPISGDKTQASRGGSDYWIIKTDAAGNKEYDQRYGGSENEELRYIQSMADGGLILGGRSESGVSGDRTQTSQGTTDFWLVKLAPLKPTTIFSARTEVKPETEVNLNLTAYPNPTVGHQVTVTFTVPQTKFVTLKLYDHQSREVATLFQAEAQAGKEYKTTWSAKDQPTGMYILRLQTPEKVSSKKLLVTK